MKKYWNFSYIILLLCVFSLRLIIAQESTQTLVESETLTEDESSAALLSINASQFGVKYRETQILMQNRRGIRIEYTRDRADLQL